MRFVIHVRCASLDCMIQRKVISVSLPPERHGFVRDLASTGSYGSLSEVVRASLRLLQEREAGVRHPPEGLAGSLQRKEC